MLQTFANLILNWLADKLASVWTSFQTWNADHAARETQAANDEKKADALTPDSTAGQVDESIDDETSHL